MGRIIAVGNQKGGVGKTTSTISLGASLAKLKKRVLLVDMDPQGCLTSALNLRPAQPGKTIAEALLRRATLKDLILSVHGMDIAPGGQELAAAEAQIAASPTLGGPFILKALLSGATKTPPAPAVREGYDFILIDCPPSLGYLTLNALTAADQLLIPAQTEFMALQRVDAILETVVSVQAHYNPGLQVLGVLPTMYDRRTRHGREVLEGLQKRFGGEYRVFDPIARSVKFPDATLSFEPIIEFAESIEGARTYQAMAEEFVR